MENPTKQSYSDCFDGNETWGSADRILQMVNEISAEISSLKSIPRWESVSKKLKKIAEDIKTEALSIKDSSLKSQPHFIEASKLFDQDEIPSNLAPDAAGHFGRVVYRQYHGQKVAVKINQSTKKAEDFRREIDTLHTVSHDNIVGFRGWGQTKAHMYLVMEHLGEDLAKYVRRHKTHENQGLSSRVAWSITNQLLQAMVYLHSRDIVHADLRPENVLIDADPIVPKPKICDFGSAHVGNSDGRPKPLGHVRYQPPKHEQESAKTLDDYKKYDVVAFGLVVLYMKTGISPYADCPTADLKDRDVKLFSSQLSLVGNNYSIRGIELPVLSYELFAELIGICCGDPAKRPFFHEIQENYFRTGTENPFELNQYGVFFECGFLKNTNIYVADSIDRESESLGSAGYMNEDLICEVQTGQTENREKPEDEDLRVAYLKNLRGIKRDKNINEHVAVALTSLLLYHTVDNKRRRVTFGLKDINYTHHRAMRLVWRSMELKRKLENTKVLDAINPVFSTSFGVHVAILTNEGPEKPQMFVFAKRTEKAGRPGPGLFTCGAVRGCNEDVYLSSEEKSMFPGLENTKTYLSLVKAAAKGLEKEIGLALTVDEWSAITFKTIYLKFDNHEWGIGGFIDLRSEKIGKNHSSSFETLRNLFTSGPKDRWENREVHGVEFTLKSMVEWIRKNHNEMASSAKIVAVKVMQERFGNTEVANAFETYAQ